MSDRPTDEKLASNSSLSDNAISSSESDVDSNHWIADSLRNHLDKQADNLDYTVTSKLSAARHRALALEHTDKSTANSIFSWFNWTTALGSTAVLAVAIFVSLQLLPTSTTQTTELTEVVLENNMTQQTLMEDLNLLSASDDIEFYQAVEFLEWMENNAG